ncbi:SRPBCC domain-containing protein [Paenibacillus sp. 2RAB27]|uniref:SRPBCC family protein n=1 Tax=Paenibacillus sp. 2RAB27 TaxID=3232991 RepID=UPI003F9A1192
MGEFTVVQSIWIQVSLERAWQAVTEGDQLTMWYSPGSPWDVLELSPGAAVYFHHSPNEYHEGTGVVTLQATIEAVESLERFALRWEFSVPDSEMITTFLTAEEGDGTRVTITETGYESEEQAKPTEEGYAMSLENLKAYLEGHELPY